MIANTIELEGTLQPDGRLVLDEKPALPPGRVRVALQRLGETSPRSERVPDAAWLDATIPAPFDLPRDGRKVTILPRQSTERLPEIPSQSEKSG